MKLVGSDEYLSGGIIPAFNYKKTNTMKHEIINRIIQETEAKSYLEIGYGDGFNFNKIVDSIAKVGVDPNAKETGKDIFKLNSDNFFQSQDSEYDVVFIDGLHHADQVRKDIINAMKCNAKAIIIHDTIPHSKEMQEVPRNTKEWTGDVWRAVVGFIESYPDVNVVTYRSDFGLTVIYPEGKKVRKHFENMEMTYEEFKENEAQLLNIID